VPEENKRTESSRWARVRVHPEVIAQRVEDELVLVHLETNQIYNLNSSAARLWELLGSGLDVDEAKQQLVQEFEVSMEQIDRDTAVVLKLLADNDFIILDK